MKRRKFILPLFALLALAMLVAFVVLRQPPVREPVYQGRPLRAWLEEFDSSSGTTNYAAAQEAIRQMGTNALPFLIPYLRAKDPPFYEQTLRLKAKLHLLRGKIDYAVFWHRRAATACGELGPAGAPAFDAMTEAANDEHAASDVTAALSRMFPDSAPVLTNILATGNITARCRAADGLTSAFSHPTIEEMGRTALLNALRDPDAGVRATAASAFQFWHMSRRWDRTKEVVVAALTRALSDPSPSVRGNAATALGNFGAAAKPAVPELVKLLQDTNHYPVRSGYLSERARQMLLKIDPEAAPAK
jgi:HEAT repeat protein